MATTHSLSLSDGARHQDSVAVLRLESAESQLTQDQWARVDYPRAGSTSAGAAGF